MGEGQAAQFIQHKYNESVDKNGHAHIRTFLKTDPELMMEAVEIYLLQN